VAAAGIALVVIYEILRHPFAGKIGYELNQATVNVGPVVLVGLAVALLCTSDRSPVPSTPATTSPEIAGTRSGDDAGALTV
jgi:hypothetical protein